jgi:hypothetical protein
MVEPGLPQATAFTRYDRGDRLEFFAAEIVRHRRYRDECRLSTARPTQSKRAARCFA